MSVRPLLTPYKVITDGDMSGNLVSSVTITQKLSMVSYEIVWVGSSPIGEVTVEMSNDFEQNADGSVKNAGNWNTLPLSSQALIAGNSDSGMINIDANAGYALRLRYTRTSGTGTMQVTVAGKVA